jgi:hypothetical protein
LNVKDAVQQARFWDQINSKSNSNIHPSDAENLMRQVNSLLELHESHKRQGDTLTFEESQFVSILRIAESLRKNGIGNFSESRLAAKIATRASQADSNHCVQAESDSKA